MAHWIYYNPNPAGAHVEDCVIRAICAATGETWDDVYTELAAEGFNAKNMPSSNATWRGFLRKRGFQRAIIPNTCPDCYTVADFADEHPHGAYILGTGSHAVTVVDGAVLDIWDSRGEVPIYYYYKEDADA